MEVLLAGVLIESQDNAVKLDLLAIYLAQKSVEMPIFTGRFIRPKHTELDQ